MPNITIQFIYSGNKTLTLKDKDFENAVKFVLNGKFIESALPFKVLFPETNKMLFFDPDHFYNFIQGNLTMPELIELTQCEQLYRNTVRLLSEDYIPIDSGSLWKLENNLLILIDEEQHLTCKFTNKHFEIAT